MTHAQTERLRNLGVGWEVRVTDVDGAVYEGKITDVHDSDFRVAVDEDTTKEFPIPFDGDVHVTDTSGEVEIETVGEHEGRYWAEELTLDPDEPVQSQPTTTRVDPIIGTPEAVDADVDFADPLAETDTKLLTIHVPIDVTRMSKLAMSIDEIWPGARARAGAGGDMEIWIQGEA